MAEEVKPKKYTKTKTKASKALVDKAIEADADPQKALITTLTDLGIMPDTAKRMALRMRAENMEKISGKREVSTRKLIGKIENIIDMALDYIDDYTLAKSTAKDLGILIGVMLDKRQLLRGEPTAILSINDRKSMQQLLPQLVEEAQRRGMFAQVIDGEEVNVSGGNPAPVKPRLSDIQSQIKYKDQQRKAESGEPMLGTSEPIDVPTKEEE